MRRAVIAAALAALAGCRWGGPEAEGGAAPPPVEVELPRPSRVLYPAAPVSFVDVVRDARPAVVAIKSPTPVKSGPAAMFPGAPPTAADPALGTGFLIAAGGSFVVTNDHIVADVADVRVVMVDGTELPARVVGRDPRLDLALLAVEAPRLPALRLGDSDQLAVGEWVVALGNPFGDEVSAAAGIVSATGRDAAGSLVPGPAMGFRTFLQVDARIHRGNSGGPVLSTAGEVLGGSPWPPAIAPASCRSPCRRRACARSSSRSRPTAACVGPGSACWRVRSPASSRPSSAMAAVAGADGHRGQARLARRQGRPAPRAT
jgi:serine protease Do